MVTVANTQGACHSGIGMPGLWAWRYLANESLPQKFFDSEHSVVDLVPNRSKPPLTALD